MSVIQANAAVDDAYAEIDLGSDQADVWVTFPMLFSPAALAFWQTMGNFSGNFVELLANDDSDQLETLTINPDGWYDYNAGTIATPPPIADTWVTVEIHRATLDVVDVYFDGFLAASSGDIDANDTRFVRFGQSSALTNAAAVVDIGEVKIGTTRGAHDLFWWPSSSTDLSAFTSTYGDVSVVAGALPSAPTLVSATPGPGAVALTWTTPADDGGSPITGYGLYRGLASGAEALIVTLPAITAYTDLVVDPGTDYFYKVSAFNVNGESPLSNELDATPEEATAIVYTRVYGITITLSDDGVENVSRLTTSAQGFS